jgi:hypothetical protein
MCNSKSICNVILKNIKKEYKIFIKCLQGIGGTAFHAYHDIDNHVEERTRGIAINAAHIEYEVKKEKKYHSYISYLGLKRLILLNIKMVKIKYNKKIKIIKFRLNFFAALSAKHFLMLFSIIHLLIISGLNKINISY